MMSNSEARKRLEESNDVWPEDRHTETTVRIEREHRWFEYGQWFTGFGSSMDPHSCNDPGVACQWLKRTVTTVATPWMPVAFTGPAAPESQPGEA